MLGVDFGRGFEKLVEMSRHGGAEPHSARVAFAVREALLVERVLWCYRFCEGLGQGGFGCRGRGGDVGLSDGVSGRVAGGRAFVCGAGIGGIGDIAVVGGQQAGQHG